MSMENWFDVELLTEAVVPFHLLHQFAVSASFMQVLVCKSFMQLKPQEAYPARQEDWGNCPFSIILSEHQFSTTLNAPHPLPRISKLRNQFQLVSKGAGHLWQCKKLNLSSHLPCHFSNDLMDLLWEWCDGSKGKTKHDNENQNYKC